MRTYLLPDITGTEEHLIFCLRKSSSFYTVLGRGSSQTAYSLMTVTIIIIIYALIYFVI